MAFMSQTVTSFSTFGKSTHLDGLAEDYAIPWGTIDNSSSVYPNAELQLTIATSSRAGTLELYLLTSPDDSFWTDNIDPDSTANQATNMREARMFKSFVVASTQGTIYWHCNDISAMIDSEGNRIGNLSAYWGVLPKSVLDGDLPGAGHTIKYAHKTLQST